MSRRPVITVIGAASTTFGPKLLRDAKNFDAFEGAELRLVDVHEERLGVYEQLARKFAAKVGRTLDVSATTDRSEALPGSDYVIISVDRGHYHTSKQDHGIPNSLGARQVLGELGGPGGLFHSLRQIPLHLDFAADIATHCPHAMTLLCSNPLHRLQKAMMTHGGLANVVGLCHGAEMAVHLFLNQHLGIDGDDMDILAAGTNHMTWTLGLRHKRTGEDLYPLLREQLAALDPGEQPLSRRMLDLFGCFPATLDDHVGEYLPFAHELVGTDGPNFDWSLEHEEKRWDFMQRLASGETEWDSLSAEVGDQSQVSEELWLQEFFAPRSWADTLAGPIIHAVETHTPTRMAAINLPNTGQIANLPRGSIVETPATVDAFGIHPLAVGNLPAELAEFNRRDLAHGNAVVTAAVEPSRENILKALLLDPTCDSIATAEATIDAMYDAQGELLPRI